MQAVNKDQFLRKFNFPREWEAWGFYPDELFRPQLAEVLEGGSPCPSEHVRYGAFNWWLRKDPQLPRESLIQLSRLAALDPDPPMSWAAIGDVMFHPMADSEVAHSAAELAENHQGWSFWSPSDDKHSFFSKLLNEGRLLWAERRTVQRIALDLFNPSMTEPELRQLFAAGQPFVLRALVEHPYIPRDLLEHLSQVKLDRFAKVIRSIAVRRLSGKNVDSMEFAHRYSPDPWSWKRSR